MKKEKGEFLLEEFSSQIQVTKEITCRIRKELGDIKPKDENRDETFLRVVVEVIFI